MENKNNMEFSLLSLGEGVQRADEGSKIKIQCPAKINLTLKVLNKREDGFHNIESIMQTISLYDYLTISIEHHCERVQRPNQSFHIEKMISMK